MGSSFSFVLSSAHFCAVLHSTFHVKATALQLAGLEVGQAEVLQLHWRGILT